MSLPCIRARRTRASSKSYTENGRLFPIARRLALPSNQHAGRVMHPPAIPSTRDWDTRDHFVQFYEREQTLIASLGEFVHGAIASGGSAIVVASVAHVEALEQDL